jgi:hypothetical protein
MASIPFHQDKTEFARNLLVCLCNVQTVRTSAIAPVAERAVICAAITVRPVVGLMHLHT